MNKIISFFASKWVVGIQLLGFCSFANAEVFSAVSGFLSSYSGVIQGIGAAMSAASMIQQANAQSAAAKYNKQMAEQQATSALQAGEANAERQRKQAQKHLGSMQAAYAASGVSMEGSALDVMEQSAKEAELDRMNILWNAQTQAIGYRNSAKLEGMRSSGSGGYLGAATQLLSAGAKFAGSYGMNSGYGSNMPMRVSDPVGISSSDIGTGAELGFGGLWRAG